MAELTGHAIINEISNQLDNMKADDFNNHRKTAFEKLSSSGLPAVKNEEYKFTNITKVLEKQFNLLAPKGNIEDAKQILEQSAIPDLEAFKLVFINGLYSAELSDQEVIDKLEIASLNSVINNNNSSFKDHFGRLTQKSRDAFTQMNTALTQDGAFIHISPNAVIEKPIAIYNISLSESQSLYTNNRNLIIAERSSEATFLEFNLSNDSGDIFNNVTTEIIVEENANISFYTLQNGLETTNHLGNLEVLQHRSSTFSAYTFTLNGSMVRNNLNVAVDGEGCETHMFGLYVLNGKTHVDNHTAVDHIQPNSFSNELYKGILEDKSKGVFNGKVYVRKEAQKTNAFQSNKNILLSDSAVINTKPQLEIWADDVKCSHGCTTGQLDEDALFYLRARGLSKVSARAMLLYAFAIEVLDNVKIEPLKVYLENKLSDRLH